MAANTSINPPHPQIDPRFACFRLRIDRGLHRWGIFAEEFIPRNRKVIEYTGQKINRKETKKRADGPLNYLFTLDAYWTIDGSVGGSGAEYINHCCDPNIRAWVFKGHILYMSLRDIQPGEELTVDYRFEHDVPTVRCLCRSPLCRGTINLPKPVRSRRKAAGEAAR